MKSTRLLAILLLEVVLAHAQPWHTVVLWEREGLDDSSNYGHTVVPLGDQNTDGYSDWAVVAVHSTYCPRSYVEFFYGGDPIPIEPYHTIFPDSGIDLVCIRDISAIGDVNGDGAIDFWIWGIPPANQLSRYWVYHGGAANDFEPDSVIVMTDVGRMLPIGDLNGDGFGDVARNLFDIDRDQLDIYFGGQSDTVSDWHRSMSLGYLSFGDLNGDGYDDFTGAEAVNQPDIYLGGAEPDTVPDYESGSQTIMPDFIGNFVGEYYDDLAGAVAGGPAGSVAVQAGSLNFDLNPDCILNFSCPGDQGFVYPIGDVNADGFDDLGLMGWCVGTWGVCRLYLGGWSPSNTSVVTLQAGSWPLGAMRIQAVAGVGDINGDGVGDFAIGGHTDLEYEAYRGRCVILSGDSSYSVEASPGQLPVPEDMQVTVYPNPVNSSTTIQLQVPIHVAQADLVLYNVTGQEANQWSITVQGGRATLHFNGDASDGTPLATGLYLLHVSANMYQHTEKLVILR